MTWQHAGSPQRRRTRRRMTVRATRAIAPTLALMMFTGVLAPVRGEAAAPASERLRTQTEPVAPGSEGKVLRAPAPKTTKRAPVAAAAPAWPAPGTARVSLPTGAASAAGEKRGRAGSLPVTVERAAADSTGLSQVDVQVLDRRGLPEAWRDGVVVRLHRADGAGGAAAAKVSVDYSSFRHAVGGDWASRLRLWQVPECSLTTPDAPGCQATQLPSVNDQAAGTVSAQVRLASPTSLSPQASGQLVGDVPSAASGGTIVALSAGSSGTGGDFGASSLSPSATWQAGGSAGDFSWSYPLRVPPGAGGPQPSISLAYSSSAVDGRSEATNNQPSWIGEGFEYSAGYIERRYIPCSEDMAGSPNNTTKTGDLCWRSDNATLSLNGKGGELLKAGSVWRVKNDDGSKIERLTGATNDDNNGEHWRVTTTDGTQYYFGLNTLPGQSTATNSAWAVPVYGNHGGANPDPCHATAFADSDCAQVWRWNLDYVIDTRGNTVSYWYDKEQNQYAARNTDTLETPYTRGGVLRRIDYGTYYRTVADHEVAANEISTTATAQVLFDVDIRCLTSCGTEASPTEANWPDTPWDQNCKLDATTCPGLYTPTFWSTKRLTKVTTRIWDTYDTTKPAPAWQNVESWTLGHSFPDTGDGSTHRGMWLASVTHEGLVGGTVSMPAIEFEPVSMPNRVLTPNLTTNNWQRMSLVTSETGARIHIYYSAPECTSSNLPAAAHTNTMMCYPVLSPDPVNESVTVTQWWHKYVVRQVSEEDINMTGAPASRDTFYYYSDGPAWHYADDDGFTKPKYKTWSQYRGFGTVKVRSGDTVGQQTLMVTKYMLGMHDDRLSPSGGKRVKTVPASIGSETVYDEDAFSGSVREQVTYLGDETKPISKTVSVPWQSPATASRTINGDTATARFVATKVGYTATALGLNRERGWRISRTETKFDDQYGTTDWVQDDGLWSPTGDPAAEGDEQCTTNTYARNLTKNIHVVRQVTVTALECGQPVQSVEDIITDTRNSYDNGTVTADPKYGLVTKTEQLKNWTSQNGTEWDPTEQVAYDSTGRAVAKTDIKGNTTTTAYTPTVGGPVTQILEFSPAPYSWKTTKKIAPYWGTVAKQTDPNGRITDVTYDAMGRVTEVWEPGWSKTSNPTKPTARYTYSFSPTKTAYPSIKTEKLNAKANYITTYQLLDALLRPRQTQAPAVGGGWVLTDTFYDTLGRAVTAYGAYKANENSTSLVPGQLWSQPEWSIRAVTKTTYDTASRAVASEFYTTDGISTLTFKWRTTTAYAGDATLVTPPAGAIPTTTVTDVKGRTVELIQHNTGAGVMGGGLSTRYYFNGKGQQVKIKDPLLNEWTYEYDVRGRQKRSVDPDKGEVLSEYNDDNELVKTTDDEDRVLVYEYDALGRKTAVYDDAIAPANKRASWAYDAMWTGLTVRGRLASSTRYDDDGNAYTIKIGGYSQRYAPSDITYSIPTALTGLAGDYTYTYGYNAADGSPTNFKYPQAGNLAQEQVTTGYDATTGLPNGLTTLMTGVTSYITTQTYTAFGEPSLTVRKTGTSTFVDSENTYDANTRRLTRTKIKPETAAGTVSDITYKQDHAGNYEWIADTPQVGTGEVQCFDYDLLRRLEHAWTPQATGDCADGAGNDTLAGPAPYRQSWTFDNVGNRQTQHDHTSDTTRTYAFPTQGPGVVRPHAVTEVETEQPGLTVTRGYSYDDTGNTIGRPGPSGNGQVLEWNAEGKLDKVTDGTAVTTNLYDADGVRLVRKDNTTTTLYLPGQELRRNNTTGVVTTTRYYTFAGAVCAQRTSTVALTWLFADHHGTQQTAVDVSTQQVTTRRQTPYGENRTGAPVAPWVNEKGFVGGDIDPTGLTHIGAREYDSELGRFISVDPVLVADDPAQYNAYQYGANNPITYADPTGMAMTAHEGGGGSGWVTPPTGSISCLPNCTTKPKLKVHVCYDPCGVPKNPFGAVLYGMGSWAHDNTIGAVEGLWNWGKNSIDEAKANGEAYGRGEISLLELAWRDFKQACHAPGMICSLGDTAAGLAGGVESIFTAESSEDAIYNGTKSVLDIGSIIFGVRATTKPTVPCKNSFEPGTLVLLASGESKPIEDLAPGDTVLAGDPASGENSPEKVVAAIEGVGTKTIIDIDIDIDGPYGNQVETVSATHNHPIWVDGSGWLEAIDLRVGDRLMAPDGDLVHVAEVSVRQVDEAVYNLTVASVHTYYVLAGTVPVLVHNCGTATVTWQGKHAWIEVKVNGETVSTHRRGGEGDSVTMPDYFDERDLAPGAARFEVDLPNGPGAHKYQDDTAGVAQGAYDVDNNSCLTYCGDVLRHGGLDVPNNSMGLARWLVINGRRV